MAEGLGRAAVGSTAGRDAGATAGLDELYRRHAPEARRLAYLVTGDHAAAEDIAQDAFVKLAGRLVGLRSPEAARAYLRKIVVTTAVSRARSRQRENARVEAYARGDRPAPQDDTGTNGSSTDGPLWEALLRLPPRTRAAIVLRHWLDLSEQRTAELLGCGVGTVKSLVSRGLATLREEVGHV